MVKVTDKDYYMDGYLKSNLDLAKEAARKDWDMLFVFDGTEGAGKSTLAQQVAYYVDPTFNIDRICFNDKEFKEKILKAEKYQAILFDEAYGSLNSRQVLSQVNRTLVKMLTEIRQKNLFIFIVLPSFFELDRYVALHRSRALIHVYAENFQRGKFMFFNDERKRTLWLAGKKTYSYNFPKANFFGGFTGTYMVDDTEYRKKKLAAVNQQEERQIGEEHPRFKRQRNILISELYKRKINSRVIGEMIGITGREVCLILKGQSEGTKQMEEKEVGIMNITQNI